MAVAAAIAVGRGDRRGAERAAVIAALEREHQALAARGVAHELERILDRLRAADVEMHAALVARTSRSASCAIIAASSIFSRCRYWLATCGSVSIWRLSASLRRRLRVAEIDRRVPHLQVEKRRAGGVVQIAAFAALEDLRRLGVVDGVAERAVARLEPSSSASSSRRRRTALRPARRA